MAEARFYDESESPGSGTSSGWNFGMRFRPVRAGIFCKGVQFYNPSAGNPARKVYLWSDGGALFIEADVPAGLSVGWHEVLFAVDDVVPLTNGVDYRVSSGWPAGSTFPIVSGGAGAGDARLAGDMGSTFDFFGYWGGPPEDTFPGTNVSDDYFTGPILADETEPPDTTPPTGPISISAFAFSPTQVSLSWPDATDDVGVALYIVERCEGAACTGFTQILVTASLNYIDPDRAPETTYRYRVRARDTSGNDGLPSPPTEVTTPAMPEPGVGLVGVAQAIAAALEPLKVTLPDLQITAFLNPNPTPPSIDIYPADLFEEGSGFGKQAHTFWTIRARTTTADSESGQRLLLKLLDRWAPESVEEALTYDQTLGDVVQATGVTEGGVSGYRVYLDDPSSGGSLIGCEWRLEVITK